MVDDPRIQKLETYRNSLTRPRRAELKAGDIVCWKKGLKNRRFPRQGEPAIVIELVKDVVSTKDDSGSPYFREPLDIILGFIDPDGDFVMYHFDSRRFQVWPPESE